MYQGTTPSITFDIKGYDLTDATVFVSFKRGSDLLTKTGEDVEVSYSDETSTVICHLSQEETLAMKSGGVIVQIRFIYENGQAFATNEKELEVKRVIYPEVIAYGGDE